MDRRYLRPIITTIRALLCRLARARLLLLCLPLCTYSAWEGDRLLAGAARHGDTAVQSTRLLNQAMAGVQGQGELAAVTAVNEFFNRRILFKEDSENWGQVDYWASPMELLQRGAGDCEDYAIAKYFTLASLGIPHERLRMVYVRALMGGPGGPSIAHMVLAYYPAVDAEPLVLDNLITAVRPASRRPDLSPVFSFNAQGLWEGVGKTSVGSGSSDSLSRWREVMRKARAEGFQ